MAKACLMISRLRTTVYNCKEVKEMLQINHIFGYQWKGICKQTKPMAVFLLGWTGSKEKNLKSYSDFYERKGFSVIKYCPPATIVFGSNPKRHLLDKYPYLIEKLYSRNLDKLPIIFHNLSNGGAYMYYTLLKHMQEDGLKNLKIAGTIFDSSPSPTYWSVTLGASKTVAPGPEMIKLAIGSAVVIWGYIILGINTVRAKSKGMDSDIERYRFFVAEELAEFPNQGPQLFLYSKADSVIPDYGVEWFIEKRRKKGVQVSSTKWDDSTHVRHMVKYPEEYISSLEVFLQSCQHESFSFCEENDTQSRILTQRVAPSQFKM